MDFKETRIPFKIY